MSMGGSEQTYYPVRPVLLTLQKPRISSVAIAVLRSIHSLRSIVSIVSSRPPRDPASAESTACRGIQSFEFFSDTSA
jgi:hypothetical protein